jgi:hypothetical protein
MFKRTSVYERFIRGMSLKNGCGGVTFCGKEFSVEGGGK